MQFVFNETTSDELGLILPKTIFRPSWAEETEVIRIPGRSEVIRQATRIYTNQAITIPAVITDMNKVRDIYSKLQGEGALVLSTAPNEYINARAEVITPEAVALDMAEIEVTFDCFPFAYAKSPSTADIGTSFTVVKNSSTIYTEPIINIKIRKSSSVILKGDVNFDGLIDTRDAALVLTEVANIASGGTPTFTPEQIEAADMNNDGVVDTRDAAEILRQSALTSSKDPTSPAQNVVINTNGEELFVGIPSEVVANGSTVTIDCGLHLIYYTDLSGNMVNILHYSSLDLPLLHEGDNYMKYTGDNVESVKVSLQERWL